ncbi:hypothetical protein [Kitasatospora fiedleri]|uniref:hypothetical protein n=1 Tax=Kitasatospora fiedleri TaxID=2991545 RepID=UPI002499D8A8|nr:hypothetical protein [Kitasatospora fiedleri]
MPVLTAAVELLALLADSEDPVTRKAAVATAARLRAAVEQGGPDSDGGSSHRTGLRSKVADEPGRGGEEEKPSGLGRGPEVEDAGERAGHQQQGTAVAQAAAPMPVRADLTVEPGTPPRPVRPSSTEQAVASEREEA